MPAIWAIWSIAQHWLSPNDDLKTVTDAYHSWRAKPEKLEELELSPYEDIPGFCKSAKHELIEKHGFVLTPGRYVGAAALVDDGVPFEEKISSLSTTLNKQFSLAEELSEKIVNTLGWLVKNE